VVRIGPLSQQANLQWWQLQLTINLISGMLARSITRTVIRFSQCIAPQLSDAAKAQMTERNSWLAAQAFISAGD
jgi:hypothetical protein